MNNPYFFHLKTNYFGNNGPFSKPEMARNSQRIMKMAQNGSIKFT